MLNKCISFMGGGFKMMIMVIIRLSLIVLIVILVLKTFEKKNQKQNFEESPVDILLKEFAKGAITEEEYLAKRKYM